METHGINSIEQQSHIEPAKIKYLMHQYPWFTKEQIIEAINRERNEIGKILVYLDSKTGSRPEHFGY
jgi:hypothetical protein